MDVANAGREIALDGVVVADPAPDLDVDVRELGDELADDSGVPGRPLDRPVQIHQVQAPRPRVHPAPGGIARVVLEHGRLVHATLAQPHALAVLDVDRGNQEHQ